VTYKTTGGGRGSSYVQTHGDWKTIENGHAELPDTKGEWKAVEYTWEKPDKPVRLLVDNKAVGDGKYLYVREVSVAEADAPATPAARPPAPKSGLPVQADFAGFGVGTYALDKSAVTPADGWAANTFDPAAAGELTTTTEDGQKVVTLANRGGMPSAQLYQAKPGGTLAAGGAYLLKLEYKAAEGTTGRLEVREKDVGNWKDCPYSFTLEATGDKWEARTFEVEAARDYPAVFVVQNLSDSAGNKLSVRKLELVPITR
jgi:hypothetical protein